MNKLQAHLRKTFLAGILAAIPLAVTVFIIYYIDQNTRFVSRKLLGSGAPFLGLIIALATIYLCGLVATTLLGRFVLGIVDRFLARVPGLRQLYAAWKQIALTPGGTEGVFSRVVLIADETGSMQMLGFTSGRGIEGNLQIMCVFVPNAPNPINGRMYFIPREKCRFIDLSPEEAFKCILSTGNYVPLPIAQAATAGHSLS